MPLPAAAVAAYSAVSGTLGSAMPFIGATAVSLAIVATHDPNRIEEAQLKSAPEAAAECVQRQVRALDTRLAAAVQPLHGTELMAVYVKDGIRGDTLTNIVIQASGGGSRAEIRPLTPPENQPDVLAKVMAGC